MKRSLLLSVLVTSLLYGGGYKIPETSLNGVALGAANVAHSNGADAAYYNPANMAFMKDTNSIEVDLIYIGLNATNFKGSGSMQGVDIDAKSETFIIPSINYVSKEIAGTRLGLSIVVPGGLTKRWDDAPAIHTAQEFSLEILEINPTVAIPIGDLLSVALGCRAIYSSGTIKSQYIVSRDMVGESWDFGYNLAISYKPTKKLDTAITYRSQVNLTQEGTAKLYTGSKLTYSGGATVSVPLPATLNIALAYTFSTKTTFEFVYERNFWSAYKSLDFNYAGNVGNLKPYFDDPIAKNWDDTNTIRLGATQELGNLILMAGIVLDETPIPDKTLNFELPDSDSLSISLGTRYQISKKINIGISALYSMKESRTVSNENLNGEFSNSNVLIISSGIEYKF